MTKEKEITLQEERSIRKYTEKISVIAGYRKSETHPDGKRSYRRHKAKKDRKRGPRFHKKHPRT